MACRCRGGNRAGSQTVSGKTIAGFLVTFPVGLNRPPETFLTKLEAEAVRRAAGGGIITTIYA